MKIALSGSSGFVGTNLIDLLDFEFVPIPRFSSIIPDDCRHVIHLGGIAHDLKNTKNEEEYFEVNTEWTKKLFDQFLTSSAETFIFFSSIKALADHSEVKLTEDLIPNPQSIYGKSKLYAEQYLLSKELPVSKRLFILRPSMIHGPGNKGNLNLLYKFGSSGLPWPLSSFENSRTFCSIYNVVFVIKELIYQDKILSGVYHLTDTDSVSTNEIIHLIQSVTNKRIIFIPFPKIIVRTAALLGDFFQLPINSNLLEKMVSDFKVSNNKLLSQLGKPLPYTSLEGLRETIQWFSTNTPINK